MTLTGPPGSVVVEEALFKAKSDEWGGRWTLDRSTPQWVRYVDDDYDDDDDDEEEEEEEEEDSKQKHKQ